MTEDNSTAPAPNRIQARIIVTIFAAAMLATAIFSIIIVVNVRRDSLVTDAAVRNAGWAVLAFSLEESRFPTSRTELESWASPRDLRAVVLTPSSTPGEWPTRFEEIGVQSSAPFAMELTRGLDHIEVQFSSDSAQPPNVTPRGRPTRHNTLADVNGWLRRRADALAGLPAGAGDGVGDGAGVGPGTRHPQSDPQPAPQPAATRPEGATSR